MATPEVWWRIIHRALDDVNTSDYQEQPVEVAFGPNALFKRLAMERLKRQVQASRVASAVPGPLSTESPD